MSFRRLFHIGPFIALFVTFFCYCASVIDSYLWLYPPQQSFKGVINLGLLSLWLSLILRNFFKAVFLGPGFVPYGWRPADQKDEKLLQYCTICKGFKAPRSHHCRTCKRCVMKMDHHCPWINTCCGHKNHTNFLLFLFFAPIGCLHASVVIVTTVCYQLFWRASLYRSGLLVSFTVNAFLFNLFALGLAIGTIVAVGVLFYQQIRGITRNQTAVEQWIVDKAEDRVRTEEEGSFIYPYDLGTKENFKQVLNWKLSPRGDGYAWPVVAGCDQHTLTVEQLKQKAEKRERVVMFLVVEEFSGCWCPVTKGCCTFLKLPISDEPRIPLKAGETLEVSRGSKYWLYGNKVLTKDEVDAGVRVRGWFPRRCVKRMDQMEDGDGEERKKKE